MKQNQFIVDAARSATMRKRLGSQASKLIVDDNFLPMFRNRQINYEEEFKFSVELAKRKRSPSRYLASVWARKNIERTIEWLRELINLAKGKAAELRQRAKIRRENNRGGLNPAGRERFEQMKRHHMLS